MAPGVSSPGARATGWDASALHEVPLPRPHGHREAVAGRREGARPTPGVKAGSPPGPRPRWCPSASAPRTTRVSGYRVNVPVVRAAGSSGLRTVRGAARNRPDSGPCTRRARGPSRRDTAKRRRPCPARARSGGPWPTSRRAVPVGGRPSRRSPSAAVAVTARRSPSGCHRPGMAGSRPSGKSSSPWTPVTESGPHGAAGEAARRRWHSSAASATAGLRTRARRDQAEVVAEGGPHRLRRPGRQAEAGGADKPGTGAGAVSLAASVGSPRPPPTWTTGGPSRASTVTSPTPPPRSSASPYGARWPASRRSSRRWAAASTRRAPATSALKESRISPPELKS